MYLLELHTIGVQYCVPIQRHSNVSIAGVPFERHLVIVFIARHAAIVSVNMFEHIERHAVIVHVKSHNSHVIA